MKAISSVQALDPSRRGCSSDGRNARHRYRCRKTHARRFQSSHEATSPPAEGYERDRQGESVAAASAPPSYSIRNVPTAINAPTTRARAARGAQKPFRKGSNGRSPHSALKSQGDTKKRPGSSPGACRLRWYAERGPSWLLV